jgi:glycogen(starch) synthase
MRILMVANTLPPKDLSGVGEQVLQLASGLRALGHAVEILGRGGHGARGPKLLFPLTAVWPTLRRIRRTRPDVVQVHESDGGLVALAVSLVRRGRLGAWLFGCRPRLVALQQVSYLEELRAVRPLVAAGRVLARPGAAERRFRWLKAPLHIVLGRLTARLADGPPAGGDRVLAPSAETARELLRDYGLRRLPAVVPNATGGLTVPPAPSPAAAEPAGFLLFVGRLRIRKGVEVLLEALAMLGREGVPARLLVAGDGEHRAAIEEAVERLQLTARVRLLGRASAGEVRALLADAAALVVPSTYEGMPLVVLEAMSAGRPVVASRVSGIPEVVLDGETGWLVPREDPGALAAALRELLLDPAEAARRGSAGAARCAARFGPAQAARNWLAAVGQPTESDPPAPGE